MAYRLWSASALGFAKRCFFIPKMHDFVASSCKFASMAEGRAVLQLDTINQHVRAAEYAVRGELVLTAETLANRLRQPGHGLPFNEIIACNIGNPQSLGQRPLTFPRQVLSLVEYSNDASRAALPADVQARAAEFLAALPGHSSGSYSHSKGIPLVREHVARFIMQRDGHACDSENIFVTDGASPAVKSILNLLIRNEEDGIMCPIPQYPLYSASITAFGGSLVPYYLDESAGWGLDIAELERSYQEALDKGIKPRAMVVINPGNPTGQILSLSAMQDIVRFCKRKELLLMADEVYQENNYVRSSKPWYSFKKVMMDMGPEHASLELCSFHSVSKGVFGECGKRGGYMEVVNLLPEVVEQLYKLCSVSLCSNVTGQLMVSLMVNGPTPGSESHALFASETDAIYQSLARRAAMLTQQLNQLEGVSCNPAEGAMYAFPQIRLPAKALAASKAAGKAPDTFYCLELLSATGICVVPGTGFGQAPGTSHFRTTFLPAEEKIPLVNRLLANFHRDFMHKYRS